MPKRRSNGPREASNGMMLHLFPLDSPLKDARQAGAAVPAWPVPAVMPAKRLPAAARGAAWGTGKAETPLRIAVDGPLRAGKSTLAKLLAERMGASCIAEPEGNPFLSRFYAGEPGMALATQMWFLRERLAQMEAAARLTGPVVADYLFEKDKLFAFLNLSDTELAVYRTYHAAHPVQGPKPDLVVYLQASPHVLSERRRRKGITEEQGLSEEYTAQVCEAYEHFFARYTASRLLVVDTSAIDFVHSERERDMLLDRILAPVHGREHFAPLAEIA